jgi:KDO2-lipid IV(A) lauroyltransferase
MQKLSLILLKSIVIPLSWLPFGVLYKISDFFAFLLHRVLKYRSKVVQQNLEKVFPSKSTKEREQITKEFYSFLADMFVEGIKSFSMSEAEAVERCKATNPEFLDTYFAQNKSVIMVFGHNENWEWPALSGRSQVHHRPTAIYKPVKNPYINQWITNNRSRYNCLLLSMKETFAYYESKPTELTLNAFIADQNPSNLNNAVWVDFFDTKTAFIAGPALIAKKHNLPIVYCNINRVKRGYYTITFEKIVDEPHQFSEEEIIQKFATRLEQKIKNNPPLWLWSHKRWKHRFEKFI